MLNKFLEIFESNKFAYIVLVIAGIVIFNYTVIWHTYNF